MELRRNLWDPFAVDGSGTEGAAAPDGGILFPNHGAFQFDATAPAAAAPDWSDIAVDIDFVDDTFKFGDTTTDSPVSLVQEAPGETQTSSLTYEELSALYPGIVWPPLSERTSPTTDGGDPRPDTSSQDDAGIETQAPSPAGLDWWVTPDFDDDPGWVPGVTVQPPHDETASTTDERAPDAGAVTTDAPPDETRALSSTLAELNEQYPGIVWPANWWLL
jgi:hypothetical protein